MKIQGLKLNFHCTNKRTAWASASKTWDRAFAAIAPSLRRLSGSAASPRRQHNLRALPTDDRCSGGRRRWAYGTCLWIPAASSDQWLVIWSLMVGDTKDSESIPFSMWSRLLSNRAALHSSEIPHSLFWKDFIFVENHLFWFCLHLNWFLIFLLNYGSSRG